MMKIKNPFLLFAIAFVGFAIFNKLFLSKKSSVTASTGPALQDKIEGWSWATTTPGQAITKWLGPGWADWVMWAIVVVFIAWIASFFLNKEKVGKTVLSVLLYAGTLIFLIATFAGIVGTYQKNTIDKSVEHPVKFLGEPVGKKVLVENARPNDEFVILFDTANVDQTGGKVYGTCGKVVRPELPPDFVLHLKAVRGMGTNVNVVKVTDATQAELISRGFNGVNLDIEFTKILKVRGEKICAND